MIKYFMHKYAMSEIGAKNLKKAIFSHTLLNFSKLCPPIVAFIFIKQYLNIETGFNITLNLAGYILLILAMFIIMFLTARFDYKRLYVNVYEESANSRIAIAERLKKLPLSYFDKRDVSDLATTMMNDIGHYEEIFSHSIPHIYATTISTIVIFLLLLLYSWQMSLALIWVIPLSLLLFKFSKSQRQKTADIFVSVNRNLIENMQEKIEEIAEIKAYNLEEETRNEFNQNLNRNTSAKIKTEILTGSSIAISVILLKLGTITTALVGASLLFNQRIDIFTYLVFLIMSTSVYLPIQNIISFMGMIDLLDSIVKRIKEIKNMPIQEGRKELNLKNYDIEFKDVYFSYLNHDVIKGVSFIAKQGEVTAIIGPSGSGKTTLVKLAARFFDLKSGKILIGGNDVCEIDPLTLLKNFAIVFQDVILFNTSIKDNIKVGKKDASDEEIYRAAKIARCDEFIARMPNGIDTIVGENGQRLSGGERQRISIARAVLKNAPIILMDEASASLDIENENLIQEALSALIKDKTVIIIAHRLRTIRKAHKIVLLNNGEIEAIGKDYELLMTSTTYKNMLKAADL